jgi:poly(A) polymerase
MVDQPRFRAAFDFMRLRSDIGEVEEVLADWWQEFSMADDNLRQDLVDQVREEQQKRQRPGRVVRVPKADASASDGAAPAADVSPAAAHPSSDFGSAPGEGDAGAPRKRRRRRRTGGAGNGAGGNADGGSGGGGDSGN